MYKNMKIAITDETHLRSVCDVLESIGYKHRFKTDEHASTVCTWTKGHYGTYYLSLESCFDHVEVTLADLLKMRDDMVKANANSR